MNVFLEKINSFVWGPGLIFLLLGTGLFYTVKLRFIQLRLPGELLKSRSSGNSGLSQFKTVCMSLGTAMGTGNITGTAAALAIGGAGSVFWMWVSAFLGMATVYAENVLSAKYSDDSRRGPMAYLSAGLGSKTLAGAFSFCCVLASFGMGGMVQVNTFAEGLADCFPVNRLLVALICFVLIYSIIRGGAKRIGTAAQYLLPAASAAYAVICIAVLILRHEALPDVICRIFREAFDIRPAAGGFLGYAITVGIRRGVFSNEAGLGSSPILHSAAGKTSGHIQGMWSMFEVFFDTMLCCTLTAVTVLCASEALSVAEAVAVIPFIPAKAFIAAELGVFALCTVIGWYYCGESAFLYLTGHRYRRIFCLLYAVIAAGGAVFSAGAVWTVSDIFNGLMALPNLTGLLLLSGRVRPNKPENTGNNRCAKT